MKCSYNFLKWMMEPEGPRSGVPAKSIHAFIMCTDIPTCWTLLGREDLADMLQQPWLIFLNESELGDATPCTNPHSGYFRAGDVQAFADWLVQRDIASQDEADMIVTRYTLDLMEG